MCSGSIFDSECDALVNPVNCVGVSGKGLALEFARRWPMPTKTYVAACYEGSFRHGNVMVVRQAPDPTIVYFPTKRHWRDPSRMQDIMDGLRDLFIALRWQSLSSVAIPALGCGLGGLDWDKVLLEIESAARDYGRGIPAHIYPPLEEE